MATAPLFSARQKTVIKREKGKKSILCQECNQYVFIDKFFCCDSCDSKYCNQCIDKIKRNVAFTYFSKNGVCSDHRFCGFHHIGFKSEKMDLLDLYNHIVGQFQFKKCCNARCQKKQLCPDCVVYLQSSFCVECASEHKNSYEDVPHFCQKCVFDRNCLFNIDIDYIPDQSRIANIFKVKESEIHLHHDYHYQECDDTDQVVKTVCGKHKNKLMA